VVGADLKKFCFNTSLLSSLSLKLQLADVSSAQSQFQYFSFIKPISKKDKEKIMKASGRVSILLFYQAYL